MKAEPIFDSISEHGEGPVWDPIEQKLYWVDILQGKYFKANVLTNAIEEFSVGQPLGFLALRKNHQGLVVGVRDGFGFFDETKNILQLIEPSPEQHNKEVRFNDGAVDHKGRLFGGTMEWEGAENKGKLFRLNTDYSWDLLEENIHISNGMGWNPEKDTFFMIDTLRHVVYAFDYDMETGAITNKRVHIQFPVTEFPDGMTIDSQGRFWIAFWGGNKVGHFDKQGTKLEEIHIPVKHTTSCCFGGENLSTLFITTSRLPLSEKERKENPLAGRTFKVKTNSVGQIEPRYNG